MKESFAEFGLSERGVYNYKHGDHWAPLEKALEDPWTAANPNGTIVMRLAENSLMHDDISEYVKKNISVESEQHLTYGQGPRGSLRLRKAVAAFFNSNLHARKTVNYEEIIITSGVTSAMDALTWNICDKGQGILIPQPLYTGFQVDICHRARGVIVPVPFAGIEGYNSFDDAFQSRINKEAFERAFESAKEKGIEVKAVLITNPHNPLGRCYPVETIEEIASFCGRHNLHLISNEIYANSVFKPACPDSTPFTSILSLDVEDRIDSRMIHVVYGASKDFCANGLRLGILQSQNKALVEAVASLSQFSWVPYVIQDIWAGMLEDAEYTASFFAKNHALMASSYSLATSILDEHGIPYYQQGNAGMFLWIDLRQYMRPKSCVQDTSVPGTGASDVEKNLEREAKIDDACLRNGLSIAPGSVFFTEEIGWFRITFTLPRDTIIEGFNRLFRSLSEVQELGQDYGFSGLWSAKLKIV